MYIVLVVAAVLEGITGLALLIDPSLVGNLLFGSDLVGVGIVVSRIAGASLLALGVACWPGGFFGNRRIAQGLAAMLTYSLIVTPYLGYLGMVGQWTGPLLWPAIGLHFVITVSLCFFCFHVLFLS